MAKLPRSTSRRQVSRRAALAVFDLSGRSTRKVFVTKMPKRTRGSQSSDWEKIGKDFQRAIDKVGPPMEMSRGR